MKACIQIILCVPMLLFFVACKQELSKKDAEKQLRAFDNEVIITAKNISETVAFEAFKKMVALNDLPLPFQYKPESALQGKPCQFNFEELKGTYIYNKQKNLTTIKEGNNSIIVLFPFESKNDSLAKFILSDYSEQLTAWNIYLPTKLHAQLQINDQTVATLNIEGKIEHEIPIDYKATAAFSNFNIQSTLHTKLSRKKATVTINSSINKNEKQLLRNELRIETTMNKQKQVVFNTIDAKLAIFPIDVKLQIDRDKIQANTTKFINQFNNNSSIDIYGNQGKSYLGKVELLDRPNNDRLNFAVIYTDNTTEYLDDFLLTISEILNIKL
jgi:hypothetical protein